MPRPGAAQETGRTAARVAVLATVLVAAWPAAAERLASAGGTEISRDQFEREVYLAARQTWYHGAPPNDAEYLAFRREVAERLIDRALLLEEAARRGIEPDRADVEARLAGYEARYRDTERWQSDGAQMLDALRIRLEDDSRLRRLEAAVRAVPTPAAAELRAYYDANPGLFTEPVQNRVSVILLAVEPSAPAATWSAARAEAARLVERLDHGGDFAELARLHSADRSAAAGGDMGYLHEGMLSADAEAAIAALAVGDHSAPVQVLEGIAIFRLTERRPERLRPYDDVGARAAELWTREAGERRWRDLVATLREAGEVTLDDEYLATLPGRAQ